MKVELKPLEQQVMVITGASSGIGLATARRAAAKGAKLVVAARNNQALEHLVTELRQQGGQAVHVKADVGEENQVLRISEVAVREFGHLDTWVNNAGASIYGRCLEVSTEDMRRLFETNFWGVVYGSRIACAHLREGGGALINVGSELSETAAPLQGIYSASKHAVKGWTDALRIELADERAPISVTLIKPGPIDTPFPEHAKNYLGDLPKHVPPVYTPDSVAEAILHAAVTPVRELYVGSGAMVAATMDKWLPGITGKLAGKLLIPGTHSGQSRREEDALYSAGDGLRERGSYPGMVRTSIHIRAKLHLALTGAGALAAGLIATAFWRSRA